MQRPSFCLSVCFWVWRCGNGSAVTGFLRSGASGAQRLVRWSKPRRAPPLAEAALGPLFQYREAESPRCGKEGRDAGEAGEGLGHASACGAQQGRGRRQLFCPPTHPTCTTPGIPHTSGRGVALRSPGPLPQPQAHALRSSGPGACGPSGPALKKMAGSAFALPQWPSGPLWLMC